MTIFVVYMNGVHASEARSEMLMDEIGSIGS